MHIPSEALSGAVCPVTAAVAACSVAAAVVAAKKADAFPTAQKFALVSTAVFAMQMLNVPIGAGVSGHVIGGVFAAAVLGVPAAVLSVALVLVIQTLLFADGGLDMLGLNVFNMAVVGAGFGGLLQEFLISKKLSDTASTFAAAAISTMAAVAFMCAEFAACGKAAEGFVVAMFAAHVPVALIDGASACALARLLRTRESGSPKVAFLLGALTLCALAVAPLACTYPDALEWTLAKFSLLPQSPNFCGALFAEYSVPQIANENLSALAAAFAGAVATFAAAFAFMRAVSAKRAA